MTQANASTPSIPSRTRITPTESEQAREARVLARLRMTPQERLAEAKDSADVQVARLPRDQRKAQRDRIARIESMPDTQRHAYLLGQRLAGIARQIKTAAARGTPLADLLAQQEPDDRAAIQWLAGILKPGGKGGTP